MVKAYFDHSLKFGASQSHSIQMNNPFVVPLEGVAARQMSLEEEDMFTLKTGSAEVKELR